ncbi:MAG TPA: hypothetical protein VER33_05880 [Polyangiaceae bacterium]|nr:hypothetical protein [Polyangiaceae bacterium]
MQTECCACGVDISTPLESTLNLPLVADEVPSLRTRVGWPWNDADFPALFGRCQLWASRRDEAGQLVRFDYMVGMGLEHGYLADVIVEPVSQRRVGSAALVPVSLAESERRGTRFVTVSFESELHGFCASWVRDRLRRSWRSTSSGH